MQAWLLGTYLCILATQVLAVVARNASNEITILVCITLYLVVLVPFAFAWTISGTVWYTQTSEDCLPDFLTTWAFVLLLVVSYIYVIIGLAICTIFAVLFWMWRNGLLQVQFAEPLLDNANRPLSPVLFPRLEELSRLPAESEEGSCIICYDDFSVKLT